MRKMLTLKSVLDVCIKTLKAKEQENPGGVFDTPHGDIPYSYAISELKRVLKWLYPEFHTQDVQVVTRCKDCRHYKRYRKKGSMKPVFKYLCELDKTERPEDFYCKEGSRRDE